MGFGVAGQCSRNRCLARWTAQIPHRGRGGEAGQATRRKTWSRARSEVFVPYTLSSRSAVIVPKPYTHPRRTIYAITALLSPAPACRSNSRRLWQT
jgi:hypothetical protein